MSKLTHIDKNANIGKNLKIDSFSSIHNNVVIGDNCWIATGVTILSGVTLGPHTIVAAGSVITKSFPDGNQMLGGVPAKVIKKIDQYSEK